MKLWAMASMTPVHPINMPSTWRTRFARQKILQHQQGIDMIMRHFLSKFWSSIVWFSGLGAFLTLIVAMRFSGASQSEVTARLTTKVIEGGTLYGAIITNSGVDNLTFESLPDIAFVGTACTANTILPTVVEKWNVEVSKWQEQETWISAVKTSSAHGK